MSVSNARRIVLLFLSLAFTLPALAHELWIDWEEPYLVVSRGHAPAERQPYEPAHVQQLRAYDAAGGQLGVERVDREKAAAFEADGTPAIAAVHSEWGHRVQTTAGKRFMSRSEAEAEGLQVLQAFSSTHHAKSAFSVSDLLWRPLGLRLELVLTGQPFRIEADSEIVVRLLFDGQAVPDVSIYHPRSESSVVTDESGEARIRLDGEGKHLLLALHEVPADDDPALDVERHMTFLTMAP